MSKAAVSGIVLCSLLLAFSAPSAFAQDSSAQSCLAAAKKALGSDAEVLKCGHLTGSDVLQTVAVVRLKQYHTKADAIPVSKLVVLRKDSPEWRVEFAVDKESMRNSAGYIEELSSIAGSFVGFRAALSDRGSDDGADTGFTIWLYFLHTSGQSEGTPVEISWNRSVGRFQEFAYGDDPKEFKPEIKNPQRR